MSRREFEQHLEEERVSQVEGPGGVLDPLEMQVYNVYWTIYNQEEQVPSNREIAQVISEDGEEISRNAVARARRRVAHKMGYKKGW